MRLSRFGVLIVLLCFAYCGFLTTRLMRIPEAPTPSPQLPAASVEDVKSDLCKLAAAEREFHRITGSYAGESELRANDPDSFPTLAPWPYRYLVSVPAPDAFTIVAMHYGPLNNAPAAVATDNSGQVCTVTATVPRVTRQVDAPPQKSGEGLAYDCQVCE